MEPWTTGERAAFADRLRQARHAKGMTLVQVAAMFDSTKQSVGHWETGRNMPSAEQIARLAAEYGVLVEWLMTGAKPHRFSAELLAELARLDDEAFRRLENGIRAGLDMPALPKPEPTKRQAKAA